MMGGRRVGSYMEGEGGARKRAAVVSVEGKWSGQVLCACF